MSTLTKLSVILFKSQNLTLKTFLLANAQQQIAEILFICYSFENEFHTSF